MPVVLVAATGGHLTQLHKLAPRIPTVDDAALWVTFDNPQSRSLLRDRNHVFVPYTGSRDLCGTLRNAVEAVKIIRSTKPSLVASTGNAVAVSFLSVAAMSGLPTAYIESAARTDGPSLTGRILRYIPGVQLFSQSLQWAAPPWIYAGSVFDDYTAVPSPPPSGIRRILVTLGTHRFGFRRLVERITRIAPPYCEIVWQVGSTNVRGLGLTTSATMPETALDHEMRSADAVIAHAGIGSAIASLDAGKVPVLVPRERVHGEHVDDHQIQIARTLQGRSLAIHRTVDSLTWHDVELAATRHVIRGTSGPPLRITL